MPGDGSARTQIDHVNGPDLTADTEGIGIYDTGDCTGYLLVSAQGSNDFNIYERDGAHRFLGKFNVASVTIDGVSDCDGLEVTSFGLGSAWPEGLLFVQDGSNNTGNQNFKLVDWGDVAHSYDGGRFHVTVRLLLKHIEDRLEHHRRQGPSVTGR